MKMKTLMIIVVLVAMIAVSSALMQFTHRIPSTGKVKTVGVQVYWNPECTQNVTMIDWGFVEPAETKNISIYIKNTSNVNGTLTIDASNWNPNTTASYINLTWNYNGSLLQENEVRNVVLYLAIASDISEITTFSFDITITFVEAV
jgi:hypothetical protein